MCVCHGFFTNGILLATIIFSYIKRYNGPGNFCSKIELPYDDAGHTFDMDGLWSTFLINLGIVAFMTYQCTVCYVFEFETQERKEVWSLPVTQASANKIENAKESSESDSSEGDDD